MNAASPTTGKLARFGKTVTPPLDNGLTTPVESTELNVPSAAKNTFAPDGGALGVDGWFPNSIEAIAI
jgi:hypothetical protein